MNPALDGLPMPAEHYRMTHCADCCHVRSEHLDDRVCFPDHGECDCTRFTRVGVITLNLNEPLRGVHIGRNADG